jgi:hypothetical protein
MPLLTIMYTFVLLIFVPIGSVPHMSPDLRAAVYAVIVVPTVAFMCAKLYLPDAAWERILITLRFALPRRPPAEKPTLA